MLVKKGVHSMQQPIQVDITATRVFVADNITQRTIDDGEHMFDVYEYDLIIYTKDEYLHKMQEDKNALEQELLDTQSALCEVYELLEGGDL